MAQITLTIPDAAINRILDAFAIAYGYDPATDGTKAQFAKLQIRDFVKRIVLEQEGQMSADAAIDIKRAEIEAINIT